ncbi:MAG TPA: YihY/virulence factor BrkB family protein [Thermoanaerobaculia bacterium]|nr:YihY/virulence factor BrkB family protein [Thermoanaerobaculia bacterium]
MDVRSGFSLVKESFKEWQEDGALDLGAALAYYTIFSIAPMLLIVIAVAGLVWGREAVQGQLVGQLQGLVGPQGGEAIQTMIANAGKHGSGAVATVIGLATVLFGATGVFVQLQNALNRIWDVEPKPGGGIWGFVKNRLISFGMILGIGFLLLVSLVLSAAMGSIGRWADGLGGAGQVLARILSFAVSFAVVTLLFAMIYKYLPDVKIGWRDVWIGAVMTALLFTAGKFLIGLYLAKSSVASSYGAAGSLIILLLWTYYSAQIVFLGAEFTQVYASRYGSKIEPAENAVPVVERKEVASAREWPPGRAGGKEKGAPERPHDDSRTDPRGGRKRTG